MLCTPSPHTGRKNSRRRTPCPRSSWDRGNRAPGPPGPTPLLASCSPSAPGFSADAAAPSKALAPAESCPSVSCNLFLQSLERWAFLTMILLRRSRGYVCDSLRVLSGSIKEHTHERTKNGVATQKGTLGTRNRALGLPLSYRLAPSPPAAPGGRRSSLVRGPLRRRLPLRPRRPGFSSVTERPRVKGPWAPGEGAPGTAVATWPPCDRAQALCLLVWQRLAFRALAPLPVLSGRPGPASPGLAAALRHSLSGPRLPWPGPGKTARECRRG